jgi:hypothetical protein
MIGRVGERQPTSLKPARRNIDSEPTNSSLAWRRSLPVSLG